jgi:hypothetical protein
MIFRDAAERSRFFETAERGDVKVPFGSWIEHAASTDIGLWGNEADLAFDCARIAALEVRALYGSATQPPAEAVAATQAFQLAYRRSRLLAEGRLAECLRAEGVQEDHPLMAGRTSRGPAGDPTRSGEDIALDIATELAVMSPRNRRSR